MHRGGSVIFRWEEYMLLGAKTSAYSANSCVQVVVCGDAAPVLHKLLCSLCPRTKLRPANLLRSFLQSGMKFKGADDSIRWGWPASTKLYLH